ncbi:MAG: class I SAM-dependent methyltransferase [Candidatus Methylomirabilales bacterium]
MALRGRDTSDRKGGRDVISSGRDDAARQDPTAPAGSAAFPEIRHVQADIFALPFRPRSFDYVMASMLLHYFPLGDAARLLNELASLARRAVLVADVERHWFPCLAIEGLSRLSHDRLVRRAFRRTVLRGFTLEEMRILARSAGYVRFEVHRHFPFRLLLVGEVE